MQNAELDDLQAGIKISGRNINNLRNADDTTQIAESEEELKSFFFFFFPAEYFFFFCSEFCHTLE